MFVPPPRQPGPETPHEAPAVLQADAFRRGTRYATWRPRGTSDWLVMVTVDGVGWAGDARRGRFLRAGDAVLYRPGTPQWYFTPPDAAGWRFLWCHFHPRPGWAPWLQWPEVFPGLGFISLDAAALGRVRPALREAVHFTRQVRAAGLDLAMNALERALIFLHEAGQPAALDPRVQRAVEYFAAHLNEPVRLAAVARAAGTSESRLAHLFRAQIGLPPQRYLETLRLQRAAQLLRSTNLRINEVAGETGYASAFYFCDRFRKHFRCAPSHYRAGKGPPTANQKAGPRSARGR